MMCCIPSWYWNSNNQSSGAFIQAKVAQVRDVTSVAVAKLLKEDVTSSKDHHVSCENQNSGPSSSLSLAGPGRCSIDREPERERENEHYLKRLIMNDCDRFKKIEMERERGRERDRNTRLNG